MTIIKKFPGMIYFSEIIPNLYVGGIEEAKIAIDRGDFEVIDVRCIFLEGMTEVSAKVLDAYAMTIDVILSRKEKVFIHCQEGIERSPLVIVWYLVIYHRDEYPDLESAYRHVIDKHPITQRRGSWVDWLERDKRDMFGKNR